MRIVSLSGAINVQHPEHGTAKVGSDGVFDVGPELGAALVKQRSHWVTEDEHIASQVRDELLDLSSDPRKIPEAIRALRQEIADLKKQVATLKRARTSKV